MTSPITEEVARIERCLDATADNILNLSLLPTTENATRIVLEALDKKGKTTVADQLEIIYSLEQHRVYGRPLPEPLAEYAHDVDGRLGQAYRDFVTLLFADPDAKATLDASAPLTPGCKAFVQTLKLVSRFVHRRAFEPKQTGMSSAAMESQVRMATAERDVALLKDELSRRRKAQSKELAGLQGKIDGVKAELAELYGGANDQYNRVQADMKAHIDMLSTNHVDRTAQLKQALEKLKVDHAALAKASNEAESALRKRAQRAALDAETACKEYDNEMLAKQTEIDALRKEIEANAKAEDEFAAYYSVVDMERLRASKDKEGYEKIRMHAEKLLGLVSCAATVAATLLNGLSVLRFILASLPLLFVLFVSHSFRRPRRTRASRSTGGSSSGEKRGQRQKRREKRQKRKRPRARRSKRGEAPLPSCLLAGWLMMTTPRTMAVVRFSPDLLVLTRYLWLLLALCCRLARSQCLTMQMVVL